MEGTEERDPDGEKGGERGDRAKINCCTALRNTRDAGNYKQIDAEIKCGALRFQIKSTGDPLMESHAI